MRAERDNILGLSYKDDGTLSLAQQAAAKAQATDSHTDTEGFRLQCLVCGASMNGETEAQLHSKESKHTNFTEV